MSKNVKKIIKLNELVSLSLHRKHTIVLNPEGRKDIEDLDEDIVYDKREWKISDEYQTYINELIKNKNYSTEDKILKVYEKIGLDYIYDDNLISYIKKVDDDIFTLPEWYGRDIDDKWEENRETHNRRICYELSRYLAKSLTELLKNDENYSVCIHWNKELTHYFVGLICNDYCITLDPDDFFNIKDLTRLKAGLTVEGIKILVDKGNKFGNALKKFNEGKSKHAIKKLEHELEEDSLSYSINEDEEIKESEDVIFLKKAVEILAGDKYKLDSQGIFEYMKEVIDIKYGSDKREKIWKEIHGTSNESKRYIRSLIVNIDNKKILIDVDKKEVRAFDEKEFEIKRPVYIRYNDLNRNQHDFYNGK